MPSYFIVNILLKYINSFQLFNECMISFYYKYGFNSDNVKHKKT